MMNEKHREVLHGQMESMLRGGRPPTPPMTNDLLTEVASDG